MAVKAGEAGEIRQRHTAVMAGRLRHSHAWKNEWAAADWQTATGGGRVIPERDRESAYSQASSLSAKLTMQDSSRTALSGCNIQYIESGLQHGGWRNLAVPGYQHSAQATQCMW